MIKSGNVNNGDVYCGNTAPPTRYYSGDVHIEFTSDDYGGGYKGFKLLWRSWKVDSCSKTPIIQNGRPGVIASPNYPNNYGDHLDCRWLIVAPENTIVELSFNSSFDIESKGIVDCWDALTIKSGNANVYCGNTAPPTRYYSGDVHIEFTSDDSNSNYKGFKLLWRFVKVDSCSKTPIIQNGRSGFITSPRYPSYYYRRLNCSWAIKTHENTIVEISFSSYFDIQPRSNGGCADALTIQSGAGSYQYCGSTAPGKGFHAGNITIQFTSDNSGSGAGFKLLWRVIQVRDTDTDTSSYLTVVFGIGFLIIVIVAVIAIAVLSRQRRNVRNKNTGNNTTDPGAMCYQPPPSGVGDRIYTTQDGIYEDIDDGEIYDDVDIVDVVVAGVRNVTDDDVDVRNATDDDVDAWNSTDDDVDVWNSTDDDVDENLVADVRNPPEDEYVGPDVMNPPEDTYVVAGVRNPPEDTYIVAGVRNPPEDDYVGPDVSNPPEDTYIVAGVQSPPEDTYVVAGVRNPTEDTYVVAGVLNPTEDDYVVVAGVRSPPEDTYIVAGVQSPPEDTYVVAGVRNTPEDTYIVAGVRNTTEDDYVTVADIKNPPEDTYIVALQPIPTLADDRIYTTQDEIYDDVDIVDVLVPDVRTSTEGDYVVVPGVRNPPEDTYVVADIKNPPEDTDIFPDIRNPPEDTYIVAGVQSPPEDTYVVAGVRNPTEDTYVVACVRNTPEDTYIVAGVRNTTEDDYVTVADIKNPPEDTYIVAGVRNTTEDDYVAVADIKNPPEDTYIVAGVRSPPEDTYVVALQPIPTLADDRIYTRQDEIYDDVDIVDVLVPDVRTSTEDDYVVVTGVRNTPEDTYIFPDVTNPSEDDYVVVTGVRNTPEDTYIVPDVTNLPEDTYVVADVRNSTEDDYIVVAGARNPPEDTYVVADGIRPHLDDFGTVD
ncbi:uncharacterized protein LOC141910083 isoform X2 [Tubulanus polymorphus]